MRRRAVLAGVALLAALVAPHAARAQGADAIDAPRISMADFKKLVESLPVEKLAKLKYLGAGPATVATR